MLRNANNIVITGGQFTSVEHTQDAVSMNLLHHIAVGAMFDSAERYPAGRCHPGTRKKMIEKITNWIMQTNRHQPVLWVYGPAGSGKSALMQSTCELLKKSHPEIYGGSFFFTRGHADREKGIKLFSTLSYQLAIQSPSVREDLNDVLRRDPSLPTKSIDIQHFSLIVEPLLRCGDNSSSTPILLIDGLDECDYTDGIETQREIIALILKSITEYNIPIRFMVASRPEYWIRDAFQASPLSDITFPLSLRDDYDADRDIRVYLTEEFEKIRLQNIRVMRSVVLPWPPASVIKHFVEEASGQYIYASTVLKFVGKGSPFNDPQKKLRIILTPGPHRAAAFSDLDRLYATILSVYPDWDTMKRVLGGLLAGANLTIIQVILCVDLADITLILDALSSLIEVFTPTPPSEHEIIVTPIFGSVFAGKEEISFYHLSFREFLRDKTRSGPYHVDSLAIEHQVTSAGVLNIINRNLDQNYETEPHVSFDISLLAYRQMMALMISNAKWSEVYDVDTLRSLITGMTERLQNLDYGRQMNHPASFMEDMEWIKSIAAKIRHLHEETTKLQNIASFARKTGLRLLSLSNDGLSITRMLLSINISWRWHTAVSTCKLSAIPGNTIADTLSSLLHHRYLFQLYRDYKGQWFAFLVDSNQSEQEGMDEDWLSLSKCRNQRVLLVSEYLKSIMDKCDDDGERLLQLNPSLLDSEYSAVEEFFQDGDLSNIDHRDYFDNKSNLSFLSVMMDSRTWGRLLLVRSKLWTNLCSVIAPVLLWFNRQLMDSCIVRLMEDHDASLPQKMEMAMNTIFQQCFVSVFTTPYFSELTISTLPDSIFHTRREPWSIRIKMLPTSHLEEAIVYSPPESHQLQHRFLHVIHFGIFGSPNHKCDKPIVDRFCWYPHLAAYLLNCLVKHLYSRANPTLWVCDHFDILVASFSFILPCLPYAEISRQNLDALRAIKYFFPQAALPWNPPLGFCSLTMEFLKKYDQSVLPSEELDSFELWSSNLKVLER